MRSAPVLIILANLLQAHEKFSLRRRVPLKSPSKLCSTIVQSSWLRGVPIRAPPLVPPSPASVLRREILLQRGLPAGPQQLGQAVHGGAVGCHVGHVVPLLGVRAVYVQLSRHHVREVGPEGHGVIGHPLGVAMLRRPNAVAHHGEVKASLSGVPDVLTECSLLPRRQRRRRRRRRGDDVTEERREAGAFHAGVHVQVVVRTDAGCGQSGQFGQGRVQVHQLHESLGGQSGVGGGQCAGVCGQGVHVPEVAVRGGHSRHVHHHGNPRGRFEVGVLAPHGVVSQVITCNRECVRFLTQQGGHVHRNRTAY